MRIYTRSGDKGETSLFDGKRVPKDNYKIEALGTLDELNACIGVTVSFINNPRNIKLLKRIQKDLFALSGIIAVDSRQNAITEITPKHIKQLEEEIDKREKDLPRLKNFILPGGTQSSAFLHLARGMCRKAERRLIKIKGLDSEILRYVNRLSDLLFVLARDQNRIENRKDEIWKR